MRGNYRVQVTGVHFRPDKNRTLYGDWRWLTISDINGAMLHSVLVREKDLPQEIAIGVERAVMSDYEGRGQTL